VIQRSTIVAATACLLFACTLSAHTQKLASSPAANPQKASSTSRVSEKEHDGQKVFEQNCERCHNAPQGFSPRISGTVSQHMRVRANLSKADTQALMRFLSP
jgi:cytochrome c5